MRKKTLTKVPGRKKHYVEFLFPGTFFSETSEKRISSWSIKRATTMARKVKERYEVLPYGFRFHTYLEADPVQVEGHRMKVERKRLKSSGVHYITGTIRTAEEILEGTDPDEAILRSNVRCNNISAVIVNENSCRVSQSFEKDDVLVDGDGEVLQKGLRRLKRRKETA